MCGRCCQQRIAAGARESVKDEEEERREGSESEGEEKEEESIAGMTKKTLSTPHQ